MAVSKRTRFEVLRRDGNACRYCHATDTPLTIDHVTPVALGGTDDPGNLVAACKDCNAGKTSSSPDATTVADVAEDAVRWAAAIRKAAEHAEAERAALHEQLQPFADTWWSLVPSYKAGDRFWDLPRDWRERVAAFLTSGMPMSMLCDAAEVALTARGVDERFRYFVGVARNRLTKLHRDAKTILADGEPRKHTDAEVREDKAYWRGFDEAFRTSLVGDGFVQARALSRVVDGANPYNTHSKDLAAAGWPGWGEWLAARS